MKQATPAWSRRSPVAGSDWFDPLEEAVRGQVRAVIESCWRKSPRPRSAEGVTSAARSPTAAATGTGRASWSLLVPLRMSGPRAGLHDEAGEQEGRCARLPAHTRVSRRAEAPIAEAIWRG